MGAGGGHGDLDQTHELDIADSGSAAELLMLCRASISDEKVLGGIERMLAKAVSEKGALGFDFPEEHLQPDGDDDVVPLDVVVKIMAKLAEKRDEKLDRAAEELEVEAKKTGTKPRSIVS